MKAKDKTYEDLMVDLETMGSNPYSPIIQIGACYFDRDTGKIGKEFEVNVDLRSSMKRGFTPDADTIVWWMQQSKEAQDAVMGGAAHVNKRPIKEALRNFAVFASQAEHVWSHATFDFVLLSNAYNKLNMRFPFGYKTARDLRTLVDLGTRKGGIFEPPQVGISHNALDDCKYQVAYAVEYLKRLK